MSKKKFVHSIADVPLVQDDAASMLNSALITNDTCGASECAATLFSMGPHVPAGEGEIHPEVDELAYVIAGSGIVYLNGEPNRFRAGDVIFVPKGYHHVVENDSDEVINMFCVICTSWNDLPELREALGKWSVIPAEDSWLP